MPSGPSNRSLRQRDDCPEGRLAASLGLFKLRDGEEGWSQFPKAAGRLGGWSRTRHQTAGEGLRTDVQSLLSGDPLFSRPGGAQNGEAGGHREGVGWRHTTSPHTARR